MFDPQKMDVDEHIDLVDTLGDMLGQKAESKKDKFIDTMPTIIQTHLITKKDWLVTTKKAKELEHIIAVCIYRYVITLSLWNKYDIGHYSRFVARILANPCEI